MVNPPDSWADKDLDYVTRTTESFQQRSEALASALSTFIPLMDNVENMERSMFATELPDEYRAVSNTTFNVINYCYVGYKVLQRLGAKIDFVGVEGDRDRNIVDPKRQIAIYGNTDIPLKVLIDLILSNKNDSPDFTLLSEMTLNQIPGGYLLDPSNPSSWVNNNRLTPLLETDHLERAFMLSVLSGAINKLRTPRTDDNLNFFLLNREIEDSGIALYQELANKNITPFGLEEVYGIVSTAVIGCLDKNSELDVRTKHEPSD